MDDIKLIFKISFMNEIWIKLFNVINWFQTLLKKLTY